MFNVDEEMSLQDILSLILSKWWIILITLCICVLSVSLYMIFYVEPVYRADTTIYVGTDTGDKEIVYNDLMLADRLVSDYRQLIKSRKVTGLVIGELGLSTSPEVLARKITVNSVKDTRIIEIAVQDYNPAMAKNVANKIAEVFQEQVVEIMRVENVQIIDRAVLPATPVNANIRRNVLISAVAGLVLGVAIIFILESFDRTVKTPQDIRSLVDLPVLGMIPLYEERKGLMK
jgi:capsular polysaccharide biosynthesis protein